MMASRMTAGRGTSKWANLPATAFSTVPTSDARNCSTWRNWTFNLLYGLSGNGHGGPAGNLNMDAAGNLFGTTLTDGIYGYGSIFKLTPAGSSWTYTSLHD